MKKVILFALLEGSALVYPMDRVGKFSDPLGLLEKKESKSQLLDEKHKEIMQDALLAMRIVRIPHKAPAKKTIPNETSERFICSHCGLSYSNKYHLREHEQCKHAINLGLKEYYCPICNISGAKSFYDYHQALHSERRDFKCPNCPNTYKAKSHMDEHIRNKHRN